MGICGESGIICIFEQFFIGMLPMNSTFIGSVDAKVDAKGRVFVPALYRKLLPEGQRDRVVLRKDPDMDCLVMYPEGVWNASVEMLKSRLDEWNPEDRMVLLQFVSDAEWVDLDSQGRILLSKRFLAQVGIEGDLVFVGMLDRVAIWNKSRYEASKMTSGDFATLLAKKMKKTVVE